jgi:phage/plasmid-like protein (TIGR03299 family)
MLVQIQSKPIHRKKSITMSQETEAWLNTQCLIGFTEKRGRAWHYKASAQGAEPNHYPHGIPIADVQRRLFSWEPLLRPVYVAEQPYLETGRTEVTYVQVPNRKAVVASDNGDVLNVVTDSYRPHKYSEWLLENLSQILDSSELGIASALLLRNRGVAVVQIEVPDAFITPYGVEFRPNIVAADSLDSSLSTLYKRTATDIVCDNTFERGLREEGQEIRVRHSRYSNLKLAEARDALQLIYDSADTFTEEINRLCATTVSEAQWAQVLDALVPVPTEEGRSRTTAEKKRTTLNVLWASDVRVEPWKNSAWGVHQAFNTFHQHYATVKGAHRVERNFDNVLNGKIAASDNVVLNTLESVLAA